MATIKKENGQSSKQQRVYMIGEPFPCPDKKTGVVNGYMVGLSLANDVPKTGKEKELAPHEGVQTAPCLSYNKRTDPNTGEKTMSYNVFYTDKQLTKMMDTANCDGDRPVLNADLIPRDDGPGYSINTQTLTTPDTPFDKESHKERTLAAREEKKAQEDARRAAKEADAAVEAGAEL